MWLVVNIDSITSYLDCLFSWINQNNKLNTVSQLHFERYDIIHYSYNPAPHCLTSYLPVNITLQWISSIFCHICQLVFIQVAWWHACMISIESHITEWFLICYDIIHYSECPAHHYLLSYLPERIYTSCMLVKIELSRHCKLLHLLLHTQVCSFRRTKVNIKQLIDVNLAYTTLSNYIKH